MSSQSKGILKANFAISVTILLTIMQFTDSFLNRWLDQYTVDPVIEFFVLLFIHFLTFGTVSFFVKLIYVHAYWKWKYRAFDIAGRWYHVHLIDGDDQYMRIGVVSVTQDLFEVSMAGENYNFRCCMENQTLTQINAQRTDWEELNCHISPTGNLIGYYTARRAFKDFTTRQGIHTFQLPLSGSRPTQITGSFQDASPFKRTGVIRLFRSEDERDQFVISLCQERAEQNASDFVSFVKQ